MNEEDFKDFTATFYISSDPNLKIMFFHETNLRSVKRRLKKKDVLGSAQIVELNPNGEDNVFYYKPRLIK